VALNQLLMVQEAVADLRFVQERASEQLDLVIPALLAMVFRGQL